MSKKAKKETLAESDEKKQKAELKATLKNIASMQQPDAEWSRFDNAALIFPASENAEMLNMYRLSALMKEPIDPVTLQYALNDMVLRFPTMTAAAKKGLFWFYLEPSDSPLVLTEQTAFPCRKIPIDSRHSLIRVTYFSHEISVEFFHVATDANGGFMFLNTLICDYLRRKGHDINDMTNCLNPLDKPRMEELTDSFQTFADRLSTRPEKDVPAYHIFGKRLPSYALVLTKGVMDADQLKRAAAQKECTVGQLGTACLIWAIEQDRLMQLRRRKKPIVVNMPVNLRKLYPSETVRNFMSMMPIRSNVEGDFDDVIAEVKAQYDEKLKKEYFKGLVNYNIKTQHHPLLQVIPLPLKMLTLRLALKVMSDRVTTTLFSNVGIVPAPADFDKHVERLEFSFGPQSYAGTVLSAATYRKTAVFTFSGTIRRSNIEKLFFRKLRELGVSDICIECNNEKLRSNR